MLVKLIYKYYNLFINYENIKNNLILNYKINYFFLIKKLGIGDWGLGIGVWGVGPRPPTPTPKPQTPNPQSPIPNNY